MQVKNIRKELRLGRSAELRRKRRIVALSALGLLDFTAISLYQSGIIRRLPDLPFKIFNTNEVNASQKAYATGIPDGTLGALLYALSMALATAGGSRRSGRKPVWDVLLGATVMAHAGGAAEYLYNMAFKQKKVCLYCLAGAGISFASLKLAGPDALRALQKLSRT